MLLGLWEGDGKRNPLRVAKCLETGAERGLWATNGYLFLIFLLSST